MWISHEIPSFIQHFVDQSLAPKNSSSSLGRVSGAAPEAVSETGTAKATSVIWMDFDIRAEPWDGTLDFGWKISTRIFITDWITGKSIYYKSDSSLLEPKKKCLRKRCFWLLFVGTEKGVSLRMATSWGSVLSSPAISSHPTFGGFMLASTSFEPRLSGQQMDLRPLINESSVFLSFLCQHVSTRYPLVI